MTAVLVPPPGIKQRLERLVNWYQTIGGDGRMQPPADEQPLRAELYSVNQLEHHANALAGLHVLATGVAPDRLISRLEENERILIRTYDLLTGAVTKNRRIVPAAEWLLDNFYLIEEQIRTARRHFPPSYSKGLPRLAKGPAAGSPRVYSIAMELISHVDGGVDATSLNAFITSYQAVEPLTLGELWAIPIMLRLGLIENLRRVAVRLSASLRDRGLATDWAERMVSVVEQNPSDLILVLADMARADPPLSSAFLAELTRHLQGQSPHFAFALSWLEHRVSEQGLKIAHLVKMESQAQAADQASISNTIASLRLLSLTDWREFVEGQSIVEQTLRGEPSGMYPNMDFATRDLYRHAVEEVAKRGRRSENEVARKAIGLAKAAVDPRDIRAVDPGRSRKAHVGYYLIDKGRTELEQAAAVKSSPRAALRKGVRRHPLFFYLSGVAALTACVMAGLYGWAAHGGLPPWILALMSLPVLMCVVHLAIGIVNWLVTVFVGPLPLPRMDFRTGIPPEHRTMVVVPTMLTSVRAVCDLLEAIEIHYVANNDHHLHFALLTDLNDASQAVMPEDAELIREAREGIEALNEKYKNERTDAFFLFHRPRRWNEKDRVWMGYERKRGKLKEFNALLRGGSNDSFQEMVGDMSILPEIRYVITLDTDTQLPRDAARGLVESMAHPLNRPVFDTQRRRVVDGYSIIQPRVGTSLPSASRSWYVRLFAADSGLDPYTRAVSDIYQDLFAEGSFIGKGIYDVDTFHRACACLPDNAILSHDLLEGAYARSALLTNVELYEDHPHRHSADVSRRRRWIRGDWQIAWWLLPRVPGTDARWTRNPISGLSKWKIFDNLRRSLVPASMLMLLCFAWLLPWAWFSAGATLLAIAVVAVIPILAGALNLTRKPVDLPFWMHIRAFAPRIVRRAGQALFTLVFIPYDACISLDSIARTLTRLFWTHRNLLEWTTSTDDESRERNGLGGHYRSMWVAPTIAAIMLALITLVQPGHLPFSGPILGLWAASPLIAWWLSHPIQDRDPHLSEEQVVFMRNLARRTWGYFEAFVTADENWLPPDNVQEYPIQNTASRTSPTNIGVTLLANLAAYDFGYASASQLLLRTHKTFETMGRMERYRGHFFNWYDTHSLRALPPQYVSTVDSGNLAGHLLVLRRGLLELIDAAILPPRVFDGVQDTARVLFDLIRRSIEALEPEIDSLPPRDALRKVERLEAELKDPPSRDGSGLRASILLLRRVADWARDIGPVNGLDGEAQTWARALEQCAVEHRDDIAHLAPWALLPPPPQGLWRHGSAEQVHRLDEFREWLGQLESIPTLRQVAALNLSLLPLLDEILAGFGGPNSNEDSELSDWLGGLRLAIIEAAQRALERIREIEAAADRCHEFSDMDFSFLFDKSRGLLAIGYNAGDHRMDTGFYDLLASEARLASFYAISQGQLGQEHWFALGRLLTTSRGAVALLSWNGSIFEYLMPLLVMPAYENTLLDQTCKAVVRRQIEYGNQRGVPWGISESGFNAWGVHLDYQYRAFGVPGLGLKRGLADDLVVAPYASVMALMVAPEAACRNLERLTAEGRQGPYGFYEAIDYTPSRLPFGVASATVRSFMTHHEGMSLLSLAYLLLDRPMQRRFQADPTLQATSLLLQERIPKTTAPIFPHTIEANVIRTASAEAERTMRVFTDPGSPVPEVHLLSNGRYHVMVSSAGGGYSRWRDLAVTRWREDPTRDCCGTFCYLRDLDNGRFWSTGYQPTLQPSKAYEAIFVQGKAEFRRRDDDIETHTEISVSPEDDIELRRIAITNRSDRPRTIEVTSYAEVVLAPNDQDLAHPAFSNLFVQTELVRARQAILCTRRPRSAEEQPPWMVHLMTVQGQPSGEISFETDRAKFVGRGRTLAWPAAMAGDGQLSGSEGPVLDPVAAIRRAVCIQPNETARIDLITGVAGTREAATALVDKYYDPRLADRVFDLAWTHSNAELQHLNAVEAEAQMYARLAGSVIYATSLYRSSSSVLVRNTRGQSGLWAYGISGDLPIVLVRIRGREKLDLVRQAVQAHAYWRTKGLRVDLVIWNEDDSIYRQELHDAIMSLIAASSEAAMVDKPGGVFLRRGEQIAEEDRVLLQAVARVVLVDDAGTLPEQVERRGRAQVPTAILKPVRRRAKSAIPETPKYDLAFFNGLGGFTHDGREYIAILSPGENTPAPWVNVIANPRFGTVVSESASVYTWAENSHDFRLTPWSNDPVSGGGGEALYIRDEETGRVWSPSPQPARGAMPYVARHGFGYSIFEYQEDGAASELTLYVDMDAPVKFARLKITNRSGRPRRLSVTAYWELVLGESRDKTLMHVVTGIDPITGAVFARNAYNSEFGGRVVFADSSEATRTITADRTEFLGRNGTPANPAALNRVRLSGRVGAGLDPCAAIQVPVDLDDGQEKEIVFTLGAAESEEQARHLIQEARGVSAAQRALEGVWQYWSRTLGVVHVETPDPALNFLANGWLMYQTLSCRIWGRTGFYQSGGAYGFRDQLQDAMALVHAEPLILRAHLLRAAARQYHDGDVQHWWHPPAGRGVRTHCSDDYLWLPYATCRYVTATEDTGVLEEMVPFLNGRPLRPEEDSYYDLPQVSDKAETLYEHCVRAINNGLRFGDPRFGGHGLPLMGSGDWNDGMNLVGEHGKGESVWLGFFLYDVLTRFAQQARRRGDSAFADKCLSEAGRLRLHIEDSAWDGQWYRRAFFDDGEPLGSAKNPECQIDSIPQSWSVLSRAGEPGRAQAAMESVDRRLVRRDARLVQLFEPPFDKSDLNPGYVKGYIPGVRENGGQYTHAAIWAAMAFADMGDSNRAWELFSLLNPIAHGTAPDDMQTYKVEPYVIAADLYAASPHTGRGGWTWYTGSAGWMYRLITESLLGLQLHADVLRFAPCLPPAWQTFKIHYRYRETFYHITVHNAGGGKSVNRVVTDGLEQPDKAIHLLDDHNQHDVDVEVH
ncbi:MAG: cyclic beta 1-2 glucan synthetase [Candidatus Hydrogenedentes bacterium]|nr:cyclic beta 1-2 glucan synthetase [Candidatus Hydrogenedentota bacterium]